MVRNIQYSIQRDDLRNASVVQDNPFQGYTGSAEDFIRQDHFDRRSLQRGRNGFGENRGFNLKNAVVNFGKGLISPITSIFSSPQNFLMAAGMMAGGAALIAATGGLAAPLLVAGGVAMGLYQGGAAALKILSARSGKEAENAFYELGAGTGAIGLSAIGAKASLRGALPGSELTAAGVESMNPLQATLASLKAAPKSLADSLQAIVSGEARTNLSSAVSGLFGKKTPSALTPATEAGPAEAAVSDVAPGNSVGSKLDVVQGSEPVGGAASTREAVAVRPASSPKFSGDPTAETSAVAEAGKKPGNWVTRLISSIVEGFKNFLRRFGLFKEKPTAPAAEVPAKPPAPISPEVPEGGLQPAPNPEPAPVIPPEEVSAPAPVPQPEEVPVAPSAVNPDLGNVEALLQKVERLKSDNNIHLNDYIRFNDIKSDNAVEGLITLRDHFKRMGTASEVDKIDLYAEIGKLLEAFGLKTLEDTGMLDPAKHIVGQKIPTADPAFLGKIHETLEPGYAQTTPDGAVTTYRPQKVSAFTPPEAYDAARIETLFKEYEAYHNLEGKSEFLPDRAKLQQMGERAARTLDTFKMDEMVRPKAPGATPTPAAPAVQWKPNMTAAEAEAWAQGSAVPNEHFHGTTPWHLQEIQNNGFNVDLPSNHDLECGRGICLALTEDGAKGYGQVKGYPPSVLKARINVKNPAVIPDYMKWYDFRGDVLVEAAAQFAKLKNLSPLEKNMLINRIVQEFFTRQGYDSVHFPMSHKAGCGYTAVFDPKQIVIVK